MKEIPLNWSCPRFRSLYTQRVMSVAFNINNPENARVRDTLRRGTLSLPKLVQSRPEELFPERWAAAFESVALARLKKEAASIDPAMMCYLEALSLVDSLSWLDRRCADWRFEAAWTFESAQTRQVIQRDGVRY